MPKRQEHRNRKVYGRSIRNAPYEPRPPRSDARSVWARIETLVIAETPATPADPASETPQEATKRRRGAARRKLRRRRILRALDVLGSITGCAVIVKLFIGDLDRVFVSTVTPQLAWILDMRWLAVLVLTALLLILFKALTLGIAVAYVALFPLVVLFWKVPKLLIHRPSKLLFSTLAGLITGFLSRARFFVVALAIACISGSLIVMGESPPMILIGMCAMLATLLWWLVVTAIDLLHSSAFIRAQERVIEWIFGFHLVEALITPEQPDQLELKKWSSEDAKKFRDTAGNAVLARRALLFWAGAVDQYRRGPAAVLLNSALVLFLLVLVVIAFAFINYGVYALYPREFNFEIPPDAWSFVYYSIVAVSFGEISALSPESGLAVVAKLANGIVGGVGVLTIIGSTLVGYRAARADSTSSGAAESLRAKADELEALTTLQFQMPLEDLQARLHVTGWGLFRVDKWLNTRTPVRTAGSE